MANFLTFSPELLLMVFEQLSDLDDAVCLARTCRILGGIYSRYKVTLLSSIIRRSDYHKYDASLCLLHDEMYGTGQNSTCRLPTGPLRPLAWMFGDCSKIDFGVQSHVMDRHLENILDWWKQTSWLRNIYLNNFEMYLSVLSFVDSDSLTPEQQQHYALALYFDRKCAITGKIYQSHSDQTFHVVSKGKFYRAVMGRFLDTKMLQFAILCQDLESFDRPLPTTSNMWSDNPNRTLEESFEILEAFDFISNFMLLHILKGPETVADWVDLLGERQAFTQDPDESRINNWMSLLPRLQPYLSPFDILAAFRMDEIDLQTLQYFTSLLAFEEYDLEPPGMGEIENEVYCKLKEEYDVAGHVWKMYRNHGWRNGVRGTSFNKHLSAGTIASEIIGFECHRRNWWELMRQSSKASPQGVSASVPSYYLSKFNERTDENEVIHFIITEDDLLTLNH